MNKLTQILSGLTSKEQAEKILPMVYDELRRLAAAQIANEQPGQTLQATSLVHEAYIRLVGNEDYRWENRGHFFSAAAKAMRRILIDRARGKKTLRRQGDKEKLTLLESDAFALTYDHQILELDEALQKLASENPKAAELVQLRVFAGVSAAEAANTLGIPERTARRTWSYAKAWLRREMMDGSK